MAEPPPGAAVLAYSPAYPCQAFRLRSRAWGISWHPEITPDMARSWAADDSRVLVDLGLNPDALVESVTARQEELRDVWRPFVARFAGLVRA